MFEKLYQEAISAVRKRRPTAADRSAPKNFLNAVEQGAWGRFKKVRQQALEHALRTKTDPGPMRVNLRPIDLLLERFESGKNLPPPVRGLVAQYLHSLFKLARSESRRHQKLLHEHVLLAGHPAFNKITVASKALA